MFHSAVAILKCQDIPEETQENKIFAHQVSLCEATTESVLQLSFSCLIMREFGISSDVFTQQVQIMSLAFSILTIALEMANVSFVKHQGLCRAVC